MEDNNSHKTEETEFGAKIENFFWLVSTMLEKNLGRTKLPISRPSARIFLMNNRYNLYIITIKWGVVSDRDNTFSSLRIIYRNIQ